MPRYGQYIKSLPIPITTAEKSAEAASRGDIRKRLFTAIRENELITAESKLMEYRGFDIILPANMKKEKRFIWQQRAGRYYVELGDTEVGGLIRLARRMGQTVRGCLRGDEKPRSGRRAHTAPGVCQAVFKGTAPVADRLADNPERLRSGGDYASLGQGRQNIRIVTALQCYYFSRC